MQLRGEIDQETYELVVQQAIARGVTAAGRKFGLE